MPTKPFFALLACLAASTARADVSLPNIFGDHMVLQAGDAIPVWGKASPGEKVAVKIDDRTADTVAGEDGTWKVAIKTAGLDAAPRSLVVKGNNTKEFTDVLIGEVWVCSGQSNMQFRLDQANGGNDALANLNHPTLRLFQVKRSPKETIPADVQGKWAVVSAESAKPFSAVGFFFGRMLNDDLKKPIGLIESDFGGTPAEAWTPRGAFETDPELKPTLDKYLENVAQYPQKLKERDAEVTKWQATTQAIAATQPTAALPVQPRYPVGPNQANSPSNCYNGQLAPVIPYGIRGVIWYQGESNAPAYTKYQHLMTVLIGEWRKAWGQGDFPFLVVSLANFQQGKEMKAGVLPVQAESEWAPLREAQYRLAETVPNVVVTTTIDIGEEKDIHPKNKFDVGKRLALAAEKRVYEKNVVAFGPTFKSADYSDGKATVTFNDIGGGLKIRGEKLVGFAVAEATGDFDYAEATIDGDKVILKSEKIKTPARVRYAWAANPVNSLMNVEGLPAAPFRTDVPEKK